MQSLKKIHARAQMQLPLSWNSSIRNKLLVKTNQLFEASEKKKLFWLEWVILESHTHTRYWM